MVMKYRKLLIIDLKKISLSVIDRYIINEIISPFLFGLGIFSILGLSAGILIDLLNKVTEQKLSLVLAVEVFLLKAPEFICYSLPISLLLATLMVYGRLSSDSEIIALRSVGISVYRLVKPALLLSLIITVMTFILYEFIVPSANYRATYILETNIPKNEDHIPNAHILYPEYEVVEQPNGTQRFRLKGLFYADRFDGEKLHNLTVLSWNETHLDQIIVSQFGSWDQESNLWNFVNGVICLVNYDHSYGKFKSFESQDFLLAKAPWDLAQKYRDPQNMNFREIGEYLGVLRLSRDRKNLLKYEVEFYKKLIFPFVCVVFALTGSALGIGLKNISKGTSFGICVAIIFNYYLFSFIIEGLGIVGVLTPLMAALLPNTLGLGLGWLLLVKTE
jgi:lipopolysaccharide export system permease protein